MTKEKSKEQLEKEAEQEKVLQEFTQNLYKFMGSQLPDPPTLHALLANPKTAREHGFDGVVQIKRRYDAISSIYLYNQGIILDRISNQLAQILNQNNTIMNQNAENNMMLRKLLTDQLKSNQDIKKGAEHHKRKMEEKTSEEKEKSTTIEEK